MTQYALELELDPPAADAMTLEMMIPAVPIVKKRGMKPQVAPQPLPRPGAKVVGNHASLYTPTWAKKEMARIRELWQELCFPPFPPDVPLNARLTFAFSRPQGHYSAAGGVKEQFQRLRPTQRGGGDVDNLCKLVLDGLETYRSKKRDVEELGAFEADDQVVECLGRKFFMDQLGLLKPCTLVEIWTTA